MTVLLVILCLVSLVDVGLSLYLVRLLRAETRSKSAIEDAIITQDSDTIGLV